MDEPQLLSAIVFNSLMLFGTLHSFIPTAYLSFFPTGLLHKCISRYFRRLQHGYNKIFLIYIYINLIYIFVISHLRISVFDRNTPFFSPNWILFVVICAVVGRLKRDLHKEQQGLWKTALQDFPNESVHFYSQIKSINFTFWSCTLMHDFLYVCVYSNERVLVMTRLSVGMYSPSVGTRF